MDESTRQRIKYLTEHGGLLPRPPILSRAQALSIGAVVIALQLLQIFLLLP